MRLPVRVLIMSVMTRAVLIALLLPAFSWAQPEIVVKPGQGVSVAPGIGANPAVNVGNGSMIAPGVQRFQDKVQNLQHLQFNGRQNLLNRMYDNLGNGITPVQTSAP